MSDIERRYTREAVELRAKDGPSRIGGYAAKFNTLSQNLGGFVERIAPGFFDKSAGDGWPGVMARYNHEQLLGTIAAGSLRLSVDGTGLDYEVDLLDDAHSQRIYKLVGRGDVSQSSFAWYTIEDEWDLTEAGFPLRTLLSGKLVDVAPVDMPAYLDTSTGLRSLAELRGVDLGEVQRLAHEEQLAQLLTKTAVVIDLGHSSAPDGQVDNHPPGRLHVLRRALEMKKEPT